MNLDDFEQELRDALVHLYDPDFQPAEDLCNIFGCDILDGVAKVQSIIIRAIESLKPPVETPPNPRVEQFYNLLCNRFVFRLTLAETAQKMYMSFSSTWREQRVAIHYLVILLWRRSQELQTQPAIDSEPEREVSQPSDWIAQTKRELASLYSYSPDPTSNVGEAIERVCGLQNAIAAKRGVRLGIGSIQPNLIAAVPSSALRQILITTIGNLVRRISNTRIVIFARMEDGNIKITITGKCAPGDNLTENELVRDIPLPDDSSVEACLEAEQVFLWIKLPSIGRINVLVVDDNLDVVHFYQRSTEGTSYRIIHLEDGRKLFDEIQKTVPDIIVLDVMLPYLDGWELLMQLHANPLTRPIPVVVCSVIREEELAMSLGATRFIAKPVQPGSFIQALDLVLVQAP